MLLGIHIFAHFDASCDEALRLRRHLVIIDGQGDFGRHNAFAHFTGCELYWNQLLRGDLALKGTRGKLRRCRFRSLDVCHKLLVRAGAIRRQVEEHLRLHFEPSQHGRLLFVVLLVETREFDVARVSFRLENLWVPLVDEDGLVLTHKRATGVGLEQLIKEDVRVRAAAVRKVRQVLHSDDVAGSGPVKGRILEHPFLLLTQVRHGVDHTVQVSLRGYGDARARRRSFR
mmetsp:Transcript_6240/g.25037  ORF Transcript_6240/g.25037 Transcript_6240/m.25037 type:complete len:229 (+) Transcript_6240:775-1461(+)